MSHPPCSEWEAICRRAGGRRRYNQVRQWAADMRLHEVAKLLNEVEHSRGYQTRIAKRLGVHRATVSRDLARLKRIYWGGPPADERHRANERKKQRVRDEDRWLWELIEAEVEKEEEPTTETPWEPQRLFAEEREQPILPPPTPVHQQPIQIPRWLPPSHSRSTSRAFPESRRRR